MFEDEEMKLEETERATGPMLSINTARHRLAPKFSDPYAAMTIPRPHLVSPALMPRTVCSDSYDSDSIGSKNIDSDIEITKI